MKWLLLVFIYAASIFFGQLSIAAPGFSYEGYLTNNDDAPVGSPVYFKVILYAQNTEQCAVYESERIAMTPQASDGYFSIQFGDDSAAFKNVFQPGYAGNCLKDPSDGSKAMGPAVTMGLQISTDGTNFKKLEGMIPLSSVPYAQNAELLNGKTASDFMSSNSAFKSELKIDGATSGTLSQKVPPNVSSYSITWPALGPTGNMILQSDTYGNLSWVAPNSGTASTSSPLSQFAATTSAQLAEVLSDETGTGAAVFANSPTLTGLPLAPTATADTNTTQIATTAFVIRQASSTAPVDNGTAATGTSFKYARADHVHASDNSGTSNYLSKFTSTTKIASSQIYDDGTNVGLGTTNPQNKLHVVGNQSVSGAIGIGTTSSSYDLNITMPDQAEINLTSSINTGRSYIQLNEGTTGSAASSAIQFTNSNYQSSSDITTLPGALTILTSANAANGIVLDTMHTNAPIRFATGGASSGNERMRITPSGNVGVGTAAPAFRLDLGGTASPSDRKLGINGTQVLYLPDQAPTAFKGSLFLGTGGTNLSHSTSFEGYYNTGVGLGALDGNTTGEYNTAVGSSALKSNTSGDYNTSIGASSLIMNNTGNNNTAIGQAALSLNTTGSSNLAIGYLAGAYIADGHGSNTYANDSIYIGTNSKALEAADTNEIVIGNNATGLGSNSIVLGNESITITALRGKVGVGTTTPEAKLEVNGLMKSVAVDNTHSPQPTTIDFATGNLQYTTPIGATCPTLTIKNLKSGGTYTLAIQGTCSGSITLTTLSGGIGSPTVTVRWLTGNPPNKTSTSDKVYYFAVMGTIAYASDFNPSNSP